MIIHSILKQITLLYILQIYIEPSCGQISPEYAEVVIGSSVRFTIAKISSRSSESKNNIYINTPKNFRIDIPNQLHFHDQVVQIDSKYPDCVQWNDLKTFVISNISSISNGTWNLQSVIKLDYYNTRINKLATINLLVTALPDKTSKLTTTLGLNAFINCSLNGELTPKYCRIVNNYGKIVSETCLLELKPVKVRDAGIWRCKISLPGSIREFLQEVIVEVKPQEKAIGTKRKESNFMELKCTFETAGFNVRWCRAISPTGEYLLLSEGLTALPYTSFNTNLKNNTCGIEIQLPLNTSTDVGRWRIDLIQSNDNFTGCFFNVPDNNTAIPTPDVSEKKESVEIGKSLIFKCSVPWPINYCYLKNPNGEVLYSKNITTARLLQVGVCEIMVKNMTLNGKWTCGVPSQNDTEELQFHTHVDILSDGVIFEMNDETPVVGKPFKLTCKSPVGKPMTYCRYTSPTNKGYSIRSTNIQISDEENSNLDKGVCILHIEKLQLEDLGIWTCAASFTSPLIILEVYADINVIPEQTIASVNIVVIMAIIMLAGIFVFAIYQIKNLRSDISNLIGNSNELLSISGDFQIPMNNEDNSIQQDQQ